MQVNSLAERPIDLAHLARQTLGDRSLELEILALFIRQSQDLNGQIRAATDPVRRGDLAHTLKGSARAVGAWRVAAAAESVEANPSAATLADLDRTVGEAIEAIRPLL